MVLRSTARKTAVAARAGFTLMELLVVVAILVVLVGVATPIYISYLEKSKVRTAKANAVLLVRALESYQIEHGSLPAENDWSSLPFDRLPVDPWNRAYQWTATQTVLGDGTTIVKPIVYSLGPNGNMGPNDECSSATAH